MSILRGCRLLFTRDVGVVERPAVEGTIVTSYSHTKAPGSPIRAAWTQDNQQRVKKRGVPGKGPTICKTWYIESRRPESPDCRIVGLHREIISSSYVSYVHAGAVRIVPYRQSRAVARIFTCPRQDASISELLNFAHTGSGRELAGIFKSIFDRVLTSYFPHSSVKCLCHLKDTPS